MSSNSLGKQGENLFKEIMQKKGYLVYDMTTNPDYWSKDIDFIVTSPTTGDTKSFEVKFDTKISKTNNLYLELGNVHSKGGLGWYRFCEADYLAYGDARKNIFYVIPMAELREKVKKLPKKIKQCGYDSIGQIVSLYQLADIIKVLA